MNKSDQTSATTPVLSLEDLSKRFVVKKKTVEAFSRVSLSIRAGEFFCMVGPSGCGKTTLLRCLAGIETPTSGSLQLHNNQDHVGGPMAMVFQQPGLFPWMTVRQNLKFVLDASPIPAREHSPIIDDLLEKVGLTRFAGFHPYRLSGGMAQRVALIRAFCVRPRVLLMDEPFVHLDFQTRMVLMDLLLELWRKFGQTIVFVTHDINEAVALADRVAVMTRRPGTIEKIVDCSFERPRDLVALLENPDYQSIVAGLMRMLRRQTKGQFEQEQSVG